MTDHTQPEALRLAVLFEDNTSVVGAKRIAAELRRQQARIAELEAQLDSIGAGGVNGPLMAPAAGKSADGWLHDNGLLYRLTDDRHPCNRDEISVTMADGSRSIESRSRRALELLDRIRSTHPSPPEGMAGWTKASKQLPPCRDDQDYIGINTAGFAGVFNAVADIAGNVHCMMETAEESVSIMSDLDIWTPFIRPPLPAAPGPADGESNG